MEQHHPLRWQDRFHVAIQEHGSQDAIHCAVGEDQERYERGKLTKLVRLNLDVQLELAGSLHCWPIRRVDERRAPRGFYGSAPRFRHTAQVD